MPRREMSDLAFVGAIFGGTLVGYLSFCLWASWLLSGGCQ